MANLHERLWKSVCAIDGADQGSSVFSDDEAAPALWVDGTQVAHFRAVDVIEIRLTKSRIRADRARLAADPRVVLRKNASDWLQVRFTRAVDIAFIHELVEMAVVAHGATDRPSRPPPSGAELARRKRFH